MLLKVITNQKGQLLTLKGAAFLVVLDAGRGTLHCCYCIYKNVLSFFAYLYKSLTVEPEKYQKNFF